MTAIIKIKLSLFVSIPFFAGILSAQPVFMGDSLVSIKNLKTHLERLADNSLRGRATASQDEKRVAIYIAEQMKTLGAEPLIDDSSSKPFSLRPLS